MEAKGWPVDVDAHVYGAMIVAYDRQRIGGCANWVMFDLDYLTFCRYPLERLFLRCLELRSLCIGRTVRGVKFGNRVWSWRE